ncbi:MAG: DUF932 domain-containing protein [Victivallales bacterium]
MKPKYDDATTAFFKRLENEWEPQPRFLLTGHGIKEILSKYETKEKAKMENNLILHCGARRVSRDELKDVLTPKPTMSWRPVPHYEVAEFVTHVAKRRGYELVKEEYGLTGDGMKMFGVLNFANPGGSGCTRALGIRNSHDKRFALSLVVGAQITVCDNLAFGGEVVIRRKHTSRIEIEELIPGAFDKLGEQYVRLERRIDGMKLEAVSIDEARVITVMAAEIRAIPSCDIVPVLDEFKEPRHEEFREPTKWSLYNSFTETAKKYSPARADFCYRRLAGLFGMQ